MHKANESISALMDGEVGEFELRRTLEQIQHTPELRQQWRRYQVARSSLKGEAQSQVSIDISGAVMSALEQEPSYHVSAYDAPATPARRSAVSRWWRSVSSMAVAASVTAVVILGAGNFSDAPSPAPGFALPAGDASQDLLRTRLGGSAPVLPQYESADVIRLSDGLKKYIDQHQHLISAQRAPQWSTRWMPEGYSIVRHELLPHGEVMVFANGRDAFSVSVEELGHQSLPEGVAQADGYIAVGKQRGEHFVTVVGDVPLMIADRIASAVQPER
ncbi:MucB/RseB C-terminal domain-containing protein [Marinobacterium weihaiense]|uniref:MucB/RseB C-terminal domain-containing protein n=1 Tax=Marinobacterium weihaiense TaxID=2851016 RepID=A0ABS6MB75_9GAMM|nr:MucB/RseB C-terminal domain-containing protein [Marinobacterium weihaiense]MBV0933548.1 MucB/RseB C-terminal domain-containing protein [Marinobacterium weihaiense]